MGSARRDDPFRGLTAASARRNDIAVAQLDQKINATDAKYANMLALEQQVKNGVEKIDANAKLLSEAGKAWLQVLQARRNALKEELRSVEDQLGALQTQKE